MVSPYLMQSHESMEPSSASVSMYNGGLSSRSFTGSFFPNLAATVYVLSEVFTSRTSGGAGFLRQITSYTSGNTLTEWLNDSATPVLRQQGTAANEITFQYWNGSTWSAVGSAIAVNSSALRFSIEYSGMGGASGALSFHCEVDGGSSLGTQSATGLDLTSATNIAQVKHYSHTLTNINTVSEGFIKDGVGHTTYVHFCRPTSNGTDVDGTGAYTDVDDLNTTTPDNDIISLSASTDNRSVKGAARATLSRQIKGVTVLARMRCGASGPTQAKLYLLISATRYYSGTFTLSTSFDDYQYTWEQDPSTATDWTNSAAEAATLEWGVEVV